MEFGLFILLMILGYGVGTITEKRHYASIRKREAELQPVLVISSKYLPESETVPKVTLVRGSAVISVDYFKRFIAGLRQIFGGRLGTYESLIDRSRREAILRMKAEAKSMGATSIFNVRLETSSVFKGGRRNVGSIEVLAYGTAVIPTSRRS
ncbi:MAG: YbjQ family protein [Alphaproteobacteria bacterium]|nr:YbjQ family protein [Alphaproteobacteria bacterium SS10]